LSTDAALGALVIVDDDTVMSVEIQRHLRAWFDTLPAAVAAVDPVGVVAGDAVEVASLEKDDETIARPGFRAEPRHSVDVSLGQLHAEDSIDDSLHMRVRSFRASHSNGRDGFGDKLPRSLPRGSMDDKERPGPRMTR
jgi:hypothetical protein